MANWCFKMLVNSINATATSHIRKIKKIYLRHIPRSIVQWLPNKYIAYACCTLWYMIIEAWIANETLRLCIMKNIAWNNRAITLRNIKSNTIYRHNTLIYNYGKNQMSGKSFPWSGITFKIKEHQVGTESQLYGFTGKGKNLLDIKKKKKKSGQNMRLYCSSKEEKTCPLIVNICMGYATLEKERTRKSSRNQIQIP